MPPTTAPTPAPIKVPTKGMKEPTTAPAAAVPAVLAVHERTSLKSISNSSNAPVKSISAPTSIVRLNCIGFMFTPSKSFIFLFAVLRTLLSSSLTIDLIRFSKFQITSC